MDYDRHRHGLINETQFIRVMCSSGLTITPSQAAEMAAQYRLANGDNRVRYTEFCESMESIFTDKGLEKSPTKKMEAYSTTKLSRKQPLSANEEATFVAAMERFSAEANSKGMLLKPPFEDYDRHSNGYVTSSQFIRALPFKSSEWEQDILCRKYEDATGNVHYMSFIRDLEPFRNVSTYPDEAPRYVVKGAEEADHHTIHPAPPQETIMTRLKRFVLTQRCRPLEFLRDFDKLRKGTIPETLFCTGIRQMNYPFSESEISALLYLWGNGKGEVRYREFCADLEDVFTQDGLETHPLHNVVPPPADLTETVQVLLDDEAERRVDALLDRLRHFVVSRRLDLKPFFLDIDGRRRGQITRDQFTKVLGQLGVTLSPNEIDDLRAKYAVTGTNLVRYRDFMNHVSLDIGVPFAGGSPAKEKFSTTMVREWKQESAAAQGTVASVDSEELARLLRSIQHKCLRDRIRLREFFIDYDRLRKGIVSKAFFQTALVQMGLQLKAQEIELLSAHYVDPASTDGRILWTHFVDAIDARERLEHIPTGTLQRTLPEVPAANVTVGPAESAGNALLTWGMKQLREQIGRKRIFNLVPYFQDFDKLRRSTVTRQQFKQLLCFLSLEITEDAMEAIADYFATGDHVNYLAFCQQVTSDIVSKPVEVADYEETKFTFDVNQKDLAFPLEENDVNRLVARLRTQVRRQRIRVAEFMRDYDKLRLGYLSAAQFASALNMCKFALSSHEIKLLSAAFQSANPNALPNSVDHVAFSEVMESVFATDGLEGAPTALPTEFVPFDIDSTVKLSEAEEQQLAAVLQHMRTKVSTHRILVKPYFADLDRTHSGSLTKPQFTKTLLLMGLDVDTEQAELLCKAFVKNQLYVNYVEFCKMLN